jgi:glycosyltransferase involved in cell wall biosynthesis
MPSLRILHCLRAPVGGLFRHVVDLARLQAEAGHKVGIIADADTGGEAADRAFATLLPLLALGLNRVPMPRQIGPADLSAVRAIKAIAYRQRADILHGHGAKGGAYARLAARALKIEGQEVRAVYTPHGGSLHYSVLSPQGMLFLGLERALGCHTDGLIFESQFSERAYHRKVGAPGCTTRIIPNGLLEADFAPRRLAAHAADFVFVGELRRLKGVDLLLRALARIDEPRRPTAVIVGSGSDALAFQRLANRLGLAGRVSFPGAMPARAAFALGRCLVVPSRAESFPYIVLEGAAAGMPMIATKVGGIPEIIDASHGSLLPAGDLPALTAALGEFLADPRARQQDAARLQTSVADRFTAERMGAAVLDVYATAIATAVDSKRSRDALLGAPLRPPRAKDARPAQS